MANLQPRREVPEMRRIERPSQHAYAEAVRLMHYESL